MLQSSVTDSRSPSSSVWLALRRHSPVGGTDNAGVGPGLARVGPRVWPPHAAHTSSPSQAMRTAGVAGAIMARSLRGTRAAYQSCAEGCAECGLGWTGTARRLTEG